MARLVWDQDTERLYETGIDRGVLYKKIKSGTNAGQYGPGVAWNGLTGVSESPSGAEETALYANNKKYLSLFSKEEFAGTIKAYTYPDEWEECDGSVQIVEGVNIQQQPRTGFGFTYRTIVGNDAAGEDYGYKIHVVYGATASPSSKEYQTINDSPEAIEFSWDFKTVPVDIEGHQATSVIVIDSTKLSDSKLKAIEDALYGSTSTEARLPLPSEIISIVTSGSGSNGSTGATGSTGTTGN